MVLRCDVRRKGKEQVSERDRVAVEIVEAEVVGEDVLVLGDEISDFIEKGLGTAMPGERARLARHAKILTEKLPK